MPPAENDAWIRSVVCELAPPSLEDNTADADRLIKYLKKTLQVKDILIEPGVLSSLPWVLREDGYRIRATMFDDGNSWRIINVASPEVPSPCGVAVDLGSSTIVVRFVDIEKGAVIDERSFQNPQVQIGGDILTRIHYAAGDGGLKHLQDAVVSALNGVFNRMTADLGMESNLPAGVVIAGNTTMTHLFMGLEPRWLCREPYTPVVNIPPLMRARDLGLAVHPAAPVILAPNAGSYFGGDVIAGILSSGMVETHETSILVDVGTNAEVAIGNKDWLLGCAGAAGPALEGGVAEIGVMAALGAIDRIRINPDNGRISFHTIGDAPPVGFCGSGLIDLAAQLFTAGMIDARARIVPAACGQRVRELDGARGLVIVEAEASGTGRELVIEQADLDRLLRSKAAMHAILTTVVNTVGIKFKDISTFWIAGTFGSYINPESAVTIGMLPDLPRERYRSIGNTSLEGAAKALISRKNLESLRKIHDRVTYIELNVNQQFMELFSAARFIPHTDSSLFPSIKRNSSEDAFPIRKDAVIHG
ncbi:MAG TPA: DUF4445 domain-containing protein [Desulfobacteraceae bacterium]|nr:DUF4445 domain-containing protein [Desulfobacteraceae bacterium]